MFLREVWFPATFIIINTFFFVNSTIPPLKKLNFTEYHNYADTQTFLSSVAANFPDRTYLYDIGKSVEGRNLTVLAISNAGPLNAESLLKHRNAKLIANMHGDEVVGKELLLHLIQSVLSEGVGGDTQIPEMRNLNGFLRETILHILPSMNPDGFEKSLNTPTHSWRENANGYDLNRNFPDYLADEIGQRDAPIQPETKAIIDWIKLYKFIFSISFHGGAVLVSYPYDNYSPGSSLIAGKEPNYSEDKDVFQFLAKRYANQIDRSKVGKQCNNVSDYLPAGIINGAQWYPIKGGMQDYNYFNGVFELTIEMSCPKFPEPHFLADYWHGHLGSLVALLQELRRGIHGRILTHSGIPVWDAFVYINNRTHYVLTNKYGFFWRLLLPGQYNIIVQVPGITLEFFAAEVPRTGYVRLDFVLSQTTTNPNGAEKYVT